MNFHHERSWWLNHTWSLAIEAQFYLLWPLVLSIFGVNRAKKVLWLMILFSPLIRYYFWFILNYPPSAMSREFQMVADGLALGCLLAYYQNTRFKLPDYFGKSWFILVPFLLIFLIPTLIYLASPGWFYVIGQTIINIGSALIVLRYTQFQQGFSYQILNSNFFRTIGYMSYSLYLWQEPFLNSWTRDWYAHWPINVVLAFLCATFSYLCIEKGFMRSWKQAKKAMQKSAFSNAKTIVK